MSLATGCLEKERVLLINDPEAPTMTSGKDMCQSVSFDVLLFEASSEHSDTSWMDHWPDGQYCCTPGLFYGGK